MKFNCIIQVLSVLFCISVSQALGDNVKVHPSPKKNPTLLQYDETPESTCLALETSTGECVVQLADCKKQMAAYARKRQNPDNSGNELTKEIFRNVAFNCFTKKKQAQFQLDTTNELRTRIEAEQSAYVEREITRFNRFFRKYYEDNYKTYFAPCEVKNYAVAFSTDSALITSLASSLLDYSKLSKTNQNKIVSHIDTMPANQIPANILRVISSESISGDTFKLINIPTGYLIIKSLGVITKPEIKFDENEPSIQSLTYSNLITDNEIEDYYKDSVSLFGNPDTFLFSVQSVPNNYFSTSQITKETTWKNVKSIDLTQFEISESMRVQVEKHFSTTQDSIVLELNTPYGSWRIRKIGFKKGKGTLKITDAKTIIRNTRAESILRDRFKKESASYLVNVGADMFWRQYCSTFHFGEEELKRAIKSGELDTTNLSNPEAKPYLETRFRNHLATKEFERWFCSLIFDPILKYNPCED